MDKGGKKKEGNFLKLSFTERKVFVLGGEKRKK